MISPPSIHRLIPHTLVAIGLIAVSGSCGDPKYHPPAIVVTFDPASSPPASLEIGASAGIAAVVTNDTTGTGSVGFTCIPTGQCGSFTPSSAGSAIPVCYLAPTQFPPNNTVTVTATSASDASKSVSATITIVSGAPNPCP